MMELEFNIDIDGKELSLKKAAQVFNVKESVVRKLKKDLWEDMAASAVMIIKQMDFVENAPLTVELKGSNKPLYETGELLSLIRVYQINQHAARLGLSPGHKKYTIYKAIHNGTRIKVDEKMRSMFEFLAMASNGVISPSKLTGRAKELFEKKNHGWRSLSEDTKYIVIPPRPFMRKLFRDPKFKQVFRQRINILINKYFNTLRKMM